MDVEVVYALPHRQALVQLQVDAGCTVWDAAQRAALSEQFPELDLTTMPLGIFGRLVSNPHETTVKAGDRIEIYRPLVIDPKELRRAKAEEARQVLQQARVTKRK